MLKNLYIPKGVMMAVFWTYSGATGSWFLLHVELGEHLGAGYPEGEVSNVWYRISVRDCGVLSLR